MTGAEIEWRARIVCETFRWVGTPYRHQASALGAGADCLGLLRGVWRSLYGAEPTPVPAYGASWSDRSDKRLEDAATRFMSPADACAPHSGDALFFRFRKGGPARHCGLYVGEGRFVHAYSGHAVAVSWLSEWWRARTACAFAFPLPEDMK